MFLGKIIANAYNAPRQSKYKRKHAQSSVPFIEGFAGVEPAKGWQSETKKRQEKEESYWLVTQRAAVAAAVGAIVAAAFAFGAFIEAQRQAGAAEEGNRPWLYIQQVIGSIVEVDDKLVLKVLLGMQIENLGHSVAYDVHVYARLYPAPLNIGSVVEDFCKETTIDDLVEDQNGRVIFSGKPSLFTGRVQALQLTKITNLELVELRMCFYYRTEPSGVERHTGTFFLFKDLPQTVPSLTKNIELIPEITSGIYAD